MPRTCGSGKRAVMSLSCERVFSLLKNLFGEQQMSAIADYVEASLKLNYNGRVVG